MSPSAERWKKALLAAFLAAVVPLTAARQPLLADDAAPAPATAPAEPSAPLHPEPSAPAAADGVVGIEVHESVVVTGERAGGGFVPAGLASTPVDPAAAVVPASSLTDLVAAVPGVASHGQGGHLQLFSIRGLARQRVMSLLSGVRLTGERRAGPSSSFLDPLLVGELDVLRGPSSTHFGAAALGGAIRVEPRRFTDPWAWAGYDSHGGESVQAVGWGRGGWSIGAAHRHADAGTAADATPLNDGFELFSANLQGHWRWGDRSYRLLVVPSRGVDIGKATTDFPRRTTRYPREDHLLVELATESEGGGQLAGFVHSQRLTTEVSDDSGFQDVATSAVDFGLRWERPVVHRPAFDVFVGLDYLGRRDVDVRESSRSPRGAPGDPVPTAPPATLDGGSEDEAAALAALSWTWGPARFEAGGRLIWLTQGNGDAARRERSAATAFLGAAAPVTRRLELTANAGTGARFPTLSEQFYSGITGRGRVIGNPALTPERSTNLELGARWSGDRVLLSGALFHNRIAGFIDRQEITPDLLTFRNLVSGTIEGVEIEAFAQVDQRLALSGGAHALSGRDDAGRPLADVPPAQAFLGGRFSAARWELGSQLRWQAAKGDPGSGEKAITEAWLWSASASYQLAPGLRLQLSGSNLLDAEYFSSADRKVPLARGRSVGLALAWGVR